LLGLGVAARRRFARGSRPSTEASRSDGIPKELLEWIRRIDRAWASRGFARPSSTPPLEHLGRLPGEKAPPELLQASREVVDCLYRAAFRGDRIDAEELAKLETVVRRLPRA